MQPRSMRCHSEGSSAIETTGEVSGIVWIGEIRLFLHRFSMLETTKAIQQAILVLFSCSHECP